MTAIATGTDLDGPVPLRLLTIVVGDLDADLVDDYLTSGVKLLSQDLVDTPDRRVAVDLRLPDAPQIADMGRYEAMVELARGLVQGYVAEAGSDIAPVNVVVSTEDQEADRETTWRFLSDPDGGLARGATLDLRSHR
jgi:hypothetical protein